MEINNFQSRTTVFPAAHNVWKVGVLQMVGTRDFSVEGDGTTRLCENAHSCLVTPEAGPINECETNREETKLQCDTHENTILFKTQNF